MIWKDTRLLHIKNYIHVIYRVSWRISLFSFLLNIILVVAVPKVTQIQNQESFPKQTKLKLKDCFGLLFDFGKKFDVGFYYLLSHTIFLQTNFHEPCSTSENKVANWLIKVSFCSIITPWLDQMSKLKYLRETYELFFQFNWNY